MCSTSCEAACPTPTSRPRGFEAVNPQPEDPHDIGPWLMPLPLDREPSRRFTVDDWIACIAAGCMAAAALVIYLNP